MNPSFEYTSNTANDNNVFIFKDLQEYFKVGLVVPIEEEYMYYAAMNSKSCRLTAIGLQYWKLVKEKKI